MKRIATGIDLALGLVGCATIMHGSEQEIGFSSTPTNAKVSIDGQPRGQTPVVVKLARKEKHVVRMELDGYQPFEAALTRGTSGWVWGNIVFGGVIGLAVDAMSGGLYQINENSVAAQLQAANALQQGGERRPPGDEVYIRIADGHDPAWMRIGTLVRK
jgi:PEGA domain